MRDIDDPNWTHLSTKSSLNYSPIRLMTSEHFYKDTLEVSCYIINDFYYLIRYITKNLLSTVFQGENLVNNDSFRTGHGMVCFYKQVMGEPTRRKK